MRDPHLRRRRAPISEGLNSTWDLALATARTAALLAAIRLLFCVADHRGLARLRHDRAPRPRGSVVDDCYSLIKASPRAQPRNRRVSPGFAFRVFDGDPFVALRPLQLVAAAEGGLASGRVFQFTGPRPELQDAVAYGWRQGSLIRVKDRAVAAPHFQHDAFDHVPDRLTGSRYQVCAQRPSRGAEFYRGALWTGRGRLLVTAPRRLPRGAR